jgi:hypothetical protein
MAHGRCSGRGEWGPKVPELKVLAGLCGRPIESFCGSFGATELQRPGLFTLLSRDKSPDPNIVP